MTIKRTRMKKKKVVLEISVKELVVVLAEAIETKLRELAK